MVSDRHFAGKELRVVFVHVLTTSCCFFQVNKSRFIASFVFYCLSVTDADNKVAPCSPKKLLTESSLENIERWVCTKIRVECFNVIVRRGPLGGCGLYMCDCGSFLYNVLAFEIVLLMQCLKEHLLLDSH